MLSRRDCAQVTREIHSIVSFAIDKQSGQVFHLLMQSKLSLPPARNFRPQSRSGVPAPGMCIAAAALLISLAVEGCLSPLAKHAAAFSSATTVVIDGSEDAYRAANRLRLQEQSAAAVYDYDKNPTWSPYQDFKPLLTPDQLNARIKVLDGLKSYADTLVDLTSSKPSEDLENAAQAVGTNLQGLNQTVATVFSAGIPNAQGMSTAQANDVSPAVLALAEYRKARTVKTSLPKVTQSMDPNITALCELLNSDIVILRRQADGDYQTLIENQNQAIQHE